MSDQPKITNLDERAGIDAMAKAFAPTEGGELTVMQSKEMISQGPFHDTVTTAQPVKVKRDISGFMQRMKVLAQMAGPEYRYAFPVKNKATGRNSTVEGGTIKMANDLAREYGNNNVDCRVVDQGQEWVFYARFNDLETGYCLTRPFIQRKSQVTMGNDAERAQSIAFQIGASKAIRNVILNALQTYSDVVFDEAKSSMAERVGKNLEGYKAKIQSVCEERGYELKRIERQITKPLAEWLTVDMVRVIAELKSISDGMARFDDLYPMDASDVPPVKETTIEDIKAKHAAKVVEETKPEEKKSEEKINPEDCANCGGSGKIEFTDPDDGQLIVSDCACKKNPTQKTLV